MKFIKNGLLLASVVLSASVTANTQSCGEIVANSFVGISDYSIALDKHNGKRLKFPPRANFASSAIDSSGFVSLKLEPGIHEFRGYAICPSGNCDKSNLIGGSDADEVKFSLKVEEGKSYKIAAKPAAKRSLIPGKRFDVFLFSERDVTCAGEAKEALVEINEKTTQRLISI
jgi:hypothetical protein